MRNPILPLLLLIPAILAAQSTTPTLTLSLAGPTSFKPAGTVVLNLTLSASSGQNVSGIQFTVPAPGGVTVVTAGAASTAVSKSVYCNQSSVAPLPLTCVVIGLNNTAYSDGVVAVLTITLPNPIVQGLSWTMPTVVASTSAVQITDTSSAPDNPCNLTGSGTVGINDMIQSIDQTIDPMLACVDLTGDGVCNILDVVRVVLAAQPGGVCKVGP